MTVFEVITTLFDTAVWAVNRKDLSSDAKIAVVDELKNILKATSEGYAHEKYIKTDGVWTHSGNTEGWTFAETCTNKRHSFFVVWDGRAIALDGENVKTLEIGDFIAVEPMKSVVLLVAPTSRVCRVFLNDVNALTQFVRGHLCL